jgi:hypothetical protein
MNENYTKLKDFAQKRLDDSRENGNDYDIGYWAGYIDGLSALYKKLYRPKKALKRLVPKKPISEECYYICPCCRGDLGVSDDDIFIYELLMPKYCSNCGCALDWSEVEK